MSAPRTCATCAHKDGEKCIVSGYYILTERKYPIVCGRDFERWTPRPGLVDRIKAYFTGWSKL